MKYLPIIVLTIFWGCGHSPYQVKTMNNEFSDPAAPLLRLQYSNSLDRNDPFLNVPTTEVNGYTYKNKSTGIIDRIGLYIQVVGYYRNLNITTKHEMIILCDSDRFVLTPDSVKLDSVRTGWNSITRSYSVNYIDYAWYPCTKEQFYKISNADVLKIQVNGDDGVREYGTK